MDGTRFACEGCGYQVHHMAITPLPASRLCGVCRWLDSNLPPEEIADGLRLTGIVSERARRGSR